MWNCNFEKHDLPETALAPTGAALSPREWVSQGSRLFPVLLTDCCAAEGPATPGSSSINVPE